MKNYKLLTPGPLTTTDTVKGEMMFDHCTWDDDYKQITQEIRKELLKLAHVSEEEYTAVLMQGSGTFGVESVLTSVTGPEDKLLVVANGAYGGRMGEIAEHAGIPHEIYRERFDRVPDASVIAGWLDSDPAITHVSMVHSETTSGILNDIEAVGKAVKERNRVFIVDAMSSFGGIDIPLEDNHIDFMISSANKCIQGVPGFSFILARTAALEASRGNARSLSLDIYDQWKTMNKDGKWRFTSPTHTVLAFSKALDELEELADTAGATAIGRLVQNREKIHPGTYLGSGKIGELREMVWEMGATGVICDDELSPAQLRNLESALDTKVMDRTMVILDIFAAHATTSEGKIPG